MGKCRRFVFYNNIDSFWRPFPVKFIGENRWKEKEENKLPHNQVISMAYTLIDHDSGPISARKIALLL